MFCFAEMRRHAGFSWAEAERQYMWVNVTFVVGELHSLYYVLICN